MLNLVRSVAVCGCCASSAASRAPPQLWRDALVLCDAGQAHTDVVMSGLCRVL